MKYSDYAKSIGKTRGYVHKLCVQGRLDKAIYVEQGRKRINKDIADAILKGLKTNNLYTKPETNPESRYTNRYTNKNNCNYTSNITQTVINSNSNLNTNSNSKLELEFESLTYDQSRRKKVYFEASTEEFNFQKLKGKYLLAEDVKKEAYRAGLIFRDKVLAVPAQVVSDLIEMTSEFEMQNYLQECLSKAIEEALNSKNQETSEEDLVIHEIYEEEIELEEAG